jgi:hydroxylamine reductase
MFCYQCEQTAGGKRCSARQGVCGKTAETAALQDALCVVAATVSWQVSQGNVRSAEMDRFVVDSLFTTVTNVDFDPARIEGFLARGAAMVAGQFESLTTREQWVAFGLAHGVAERRARFGAVLAGVLETAVYGLKGAAAYFHHAARLSYEDAVVCGRLHETLAWLVFEENPTLDEALARVLVVGEINLRAMELLDAANTETFGHPEPTAVRVTPVAGRCVLVSGHDLKDLLDLLRQTEGTGINVYTHGEMLPANAYPKLKAFGHLVGNYGGAWQDQQREFAEFPGPILMTTNCIQKPMPAYRGRIFTTGLVAHEDAQHVENGHFGPVIEATLAAPGFAETAPEKRIIVGFGRNAVLSVADKVVAAVKAGAIRHFFLVGGCDGAKPGRNYYTEFVANTPKDTVVLTLACGKYRFNKDDHGDIGGIPRLLDVGQCNDAYSAIQIAVALSKAFGVGVNDLPLSLVLSWYEQKAVAILLTLLHLGIRNIRLGPTLPAFLEPEAVQVLVDKFAIKPTTTAEADLREILSGK